LVALIVWQLITGLAIAGYFLETKVCHSQTTIFYNIALFQSGHAWGSHLLIFMALLHFFIALKNNCYQEPRELAWLTGVILGILALLSFMSGLLLQNFYLKEKIVLLENFPCIVNVFWCMVVHISALPLLLAFLLVFHIQAAKKNY
jgi:quinol-cytochrome oxidoreductase complex cytochrome b subunit